MATLMTGSTVAELTGLNTLSAITDRNYGGAALAASAGNAPSPSTPQIWHPDHPLFWAGALIAVMFGLIGVSTSARVGPVRGRVAVGKGEK